MVDAMGFIVLGVGIAVVAVAVALLTKVRPKGMVASIPQTPISNTVTEEKDVEHSTDSTIQTISEAQTTTTTQQTPLQNTGEEESAVKVLTEGTISKSRKKSSVPRQTKRSRSRTQQSSGKAE